MSTAASANAGGGGQQGSEVDGWRVATLRSRGPEDGAHAEEGKDCPADPRPLESLLPVGDRQQKSQQWDQGQDYLGSTRLHADESPVDQAKRSGKVESPKNERTQERTPTWHVDAPDNDKPEQEQRRDAEPEAGSQKGASSRLLNRMATPLPPPSNTSVAKASHVRRSRRPGIVNAGRRARGYA